jgi:hypothetical protein
MPIIFLTFEPWNYSEAEREVRSKCGRVLQVGKSWEEWRKLILARKQIFML